MLALTLRDKKTVIEQTGVITASYHVLRAITDSDFIKTNDLEFRILLFDILYGEIYTPAAKRKYGYYTLPVLWGGNFIGRIETVADHKSAALRVKNIWSEPGVRQSGKLQLSLDRTLRCFARFNNCSTVELCE